MRARRLSVALIAVMLLVLAGHQPSADIRIIAQDSGDPSPHRVQAAVDLGVVAVSLLWTWSGQHWLDER